MILNHFPCSYGHCTDVDQRQETHNIAWWHTQYFCRERIEHASRRNGKRGRFELWRRWFGRCKFGDDILYLMHDNVVHNIEVMPRIGTRSEIIINSHLRWHSFTSPLEFPPLSCQRGNGWPRSQARSRRDWWHSSCRRAHPLPEVSPQWHGSGGGSLESLCPARRIRQH